MNLMENLVRAEKVVLGSVLLDNVHWQQVGKVPEEYFSIDSHRRIFRAMQDVVDHDQRIDYATVIDALSRTGELQKVGGEPYVHFLTDGLAARSDIQFHLALLKEHWVRRAAQKTGEWLEANAPDRTVSPTALIDLAERLAAAEAAGPLPPRFSDDDVAHRFSRTCGTDWKYVAQRGHWLFWEGTRWVHDVTFAVKERIRQICRATSNACGVKQKSLARGLASNRRIAAVENILRSDPRHAATVDQWDSDPWVLNTPEGTVDLKTGQLHPHCREQYLTKMTAASRGDECPRWMDFLDEVTGGNLDLQHFLQRMVGYFLTGVTWEHSVFFLYGTGANGKSVFLSTITGLLGDYAKIASSTVFTANKNEQHPTELAALVGARLVTASETEEGQCWAEAKLKSITGGEQITARFMRQDFFEYLPQFKPVIEGNHKPALKNVDEAMRRRMILVPFIVTIPEEQRDLELAEKLKAEYPGILRWAVEGCLAWLEERLNPPAVVRAATEDYLSSEDSVATWIEEQCECQPAARTPVGLLYASWCRWCEACGEEPGKLKRLAQALQDRGFVRARTNRARFFVGIRLKGAGS